MYSPKHFCQDDRNAIVEFMQSHPFATLATHSGQSVTADHLPLFTQVKEDGSLLLKGHVARANSVWRVAQEQPALAIFHGPQTYIRPVHTPLSSDTAK